MFSSCMPLKMQTEPVSSFLKAKYILVSVIWDILSAKSDVNGFKDFFSFCLQF